MIILDAYAIQIDAVYHDTDAPRRVQPSGSAACTGGPDPSSPCFGATILAAAVRSAATEAAVNLLFPRLE
jgi:hypothetical protein